MPFEKKRESLPQAQVGVSERSNIRMKKLAAPRCPVSTKTSPYYQADEMTCQHEMANYPGWWKVCEKRGHEPYFTITRTIKKEPVLAEDGSGLITGYREVQHEKRKLNINQVPIGTRFASGRAEAITKGLKGRKELKEFGYNDLCEYRNCELDAKVKSKYGFFCSDRHARLIGADVEAIMLSVKQGEKNKQLRDIDPEFEGAIVLQSPPDLDAL